LLSSFSIDQFAVSHSFISLTALPLLLINPAFDLLHLYPESAEPCFDHQHLQRNCTQLLAEYLCATRLAWDLRRSCTRYSIQDAGVTLQP
jgi:hypothetical protein